MRYWLGRLAFSLLIVGAAVGWETYRAMTLPGGLAAWRVWIQFGLAGVLIVCGVWGMVMRHGGNKGD